MSTAFPIRYWGSTCAVCGESLCVGQPAQYDADDDLVHAHCLHPVRKQAICPICTMTKPCECDEDDT